MGWMPLYLDIHLKHTPSLKKKRTKYENSNKNIHETCLITVCMGVILWRCMGTIFVIMRSWHRAAYLSTHGCKWGSTLSVCGKSQSHPLSTHSPDKMEAAAAQCCSKVLIWLQTLQARNWLRKQMFYLCPTQSGKMLLFIMEASTSIYEDVLIV